MNYVVLDMEWNQPGFLDTALCRNGVCMKNEIIQIGAVKLDGNMSKTGTFSCIIKPQSLTSMNKIIKQLTGITDEMLDRGESFEKAVERFREFCGEDYVIFIWGYDDVRIIRNNLAFHGLDDSWLPKSYNVQMMFCTQTNNEKRQYSLEYALEYFDIKIENSLHDAYNDAEYTALVCTKLDVKKGMEEIDKSGNGESKGDKSKGVLIKRKFKYLRRREDIWANGFITRPSCPVCGEKMKFDKHKSFGVHKVHIEGHCEKDGDFMIVLKISETPDKTFTVSQQMYVLDEAMREYFAAKENTKHRRSRRGKRNYSVLKEKAEV